MARAGASRPAPAVEQPAAIRFQRLIDNVDDLVYRMQAVMPPLRAPSVYGSSAAEPITGHSPEEFYLDPNLAAKAVHPEDVHLLFADGVDSASMDSRFTLRWVHSERKIVWAEHLRVPVYDETGRVVAVEGIARDVTERVETQQRLSESEEQLRQLAGRIQTAREEERAALRPLSSTTSSARR